MGVPTKVGQSWGSQPAPPFQTYATALVLAVGGYLFFDRSFAWIHVPRTPVFVGEALLALGLVEAARVSRISLLLRGIVRAVPPLNILVLFIGLGAAHLLWAYPRHGILAIRDSAIWYYGLFAFLVAASIVVRPQRLNWMIGWYRRVLPFLLLWVPVAIVLNKTLKDAVPTVPDSQTSLFSFKGGDFAVQAAIAVAFLWLCAEPRSLRQKRARFMLTGVGLIGIVVAGTQNRGGMVAALVILGATVVLSPQKVRAFYTTAIILVVVMGLAVFFDVSVQLKREVSARQVVENFASITAEDPASGDDAMSGTVRWRLEFWQRVIDDTLFGDHALAGHGLGPNLAEMYGANPVDDPDTPLRNAHNSHLTILARMGIPGFALWAAFWLMWMAYMASRAGLHRSPRSRPPESGIHSWLLIGLLGILVNAVFDPTLEGPQVAIPAWTMVGMASALAVPEVARLTGATLSRSGSKAAPPLQLDLAEPTRPLARARR